MKSVYKKRIVITGSSGLLGKYFSKKFKKKYIIYKYPYRIENIKKFAKWIKRKNFEYFIHFAAISKKSPRKLNRINSIASVNIIKHLSKKKSLKYFLFISTSHVYRYSKTKISEKQKPKPINNYGLSKKRVEDMGFKIKFVPSSKRAEWIDKNLGLKKCIYMGDRIFDHLVMKKALYSIVPNGSLEHVSKSANFITKNNPAQRAVAEAVIHILKYFFSVNFSRLKKIDL